MAKVVNHEPLNTRQPIQNTFVESFNGRFRDECLNQYWFTSLADANEIIAAWKVDYRGQGQGNEWSSLHYGWNSDNFSLK